ncbi:MAG TPA: hypothetical protein VGP18_08900 [Solirubrobacteraceae bacterium]|nr:hypothetical protein [Solirubrobacteraceae bacterium]
MSFFDDEDEEPPTTVRPARTQQQPRPQPRRPQRGGGGTGAGGGGPSSIDHHAMMVRRRIAAGVGVVLLIAIVLLVNGCLKRGKQQALESYNQNVNQIAAESESQVAKPLFTTLSSASGKQALQVETQVDQLRRQSEEIAEHAKGLSVPSEMTSAQRNLLLALNLRVEGLTKIAGLVREALGSKAQQASTYIAGAMEIFLASDVLYSQRVVPLIQQTLTSSGVNGQTTTPSHFLPNLGWLTPSTVQAKLTGQATAGSGAVAPGTHGSALKGVSVGTNTLEPSPTINHVSGGANPTFTAMVEDSGSNPETDVKVNVSVTTEGKTLTASHTIEKTEPGQTYNANVTVKGVTLEAASRVNVNVAPVPGETDVENNKASFIVIFGK